MFKWFIKRIYRELLEKAYQEGLSRGYNLGYQSGLTEHNNRAVIFGSNIDKEVNKILKESGF